MYDGDALWYISKSEIRKEALDVVSKKGKYNILTPNKGEF